MKIILLLLEVMFVQNGRQRRDNFTNYEFSFCFSVVTVGS